MGKWHRIISIHFRTFITKEIPDMSKQSFSYQTQCKVEQRRATVEQHGEQGSGGGDEEADVPAHHHPQRLQDLQEPHQNSKTSTSTRSASQF